MKSAIVAGLLIVPFLASAHGQSVIKGHDLNLPGSAVRIKTLQNQVEKQQIEIDSLRLRLGKLQEAFQQLAEMIVDQNSDADDDDSSDDADVTSLRVRGLSRGATPNKTNAARSVITVLTDKSRFDGHFRAVRKGPVKTLQPLD